MKFIKFIAVIILAGAGCVTMPVVETNSPTTILEWNVPVIEPLKETIVAQEKGKVLLSIAPVQYVSDKRYTVKEVPTAGPLGVLSNFVVSDVKYYNQLTIPSAIISPDKLEFLLTIYNRLDRVFRGAGAVVSFTIDGKISGLDQYNYDDFLNMLVPPRGQKQVTISGPALSSLPDKCIVGVFIYDVVTEMDSIGNPLKKSNYEWYFDISHKTVKETAPIQVHQIQR